MSAASAAALTDSTLTDAEAPVSVVREAEGVAGVDEPVDEELAAAAAADTFAAWYI